jgi:hypothetical protein
VSTVGGGVAPTLIVQVTRNQVVQLSAFTPFEIGGIVLLVLASIGGIVGAAFLVQTWPRHTESPSEPGDTGGPTTALPA